MQTAIEKREFVLDLIGYPRQLADDYPKDHLLAFAWPKGSMETVGPVLSITHDDWEELGKPSVITLTVVPGDMLNEEA